MTAPGTTRFRAFLPRAMLAGVRLRPSFPAAFRAKLSTRASGQMPAARRLAAFLRMIVLHSAATQTRLGITMRRGTKEGRALLPRLALSRVSLPRVALSHLVMSRATASRVTTSRHVLAQFARARLTLPHHALSHSGPSHSGPHRLVSGRPDSSRVASGARMAGARGRAYCLLGAGMVGACILGSSQPAFSAAPRAAAKNLAACMALVNDDPADAQDYATSWLHQGGGNPARQCMAQADLELDLPVEAATAFDALAHDPAGCGKIAGYVACRADFAHEASRAWLLAGKTAQARDSASFGLGLLPPGNDALAIALHIARDRALMHMTQAQDALTDLAALPDAALPVEGLVLRANAERLTNHMDAAAHDIALAFQREPQNPAVLLERGILHQRIDDTKGAQADWNAVIAVAPDSPEADLARQDLDVLRADPDHSPDLADAR